MAKKWLYMKKLDLFHTYTEPVNSLINNILVITE